MKQLAHPKKLIQVSTIWFLPIILIIIESLFFVTKHGWQAHDIMYYLSFWIIRILLTPLIIYYTYVFWTEHTQKFRLIATHLLGFLLFSFIFTSIAYLLLHQLLLNNEFPFVPGNSTKAYIYWLIADNSIAINVMVYISTVVIYYILEYSRRVVNANQKALELNKLLMDSRLELLKNQLNTHFLFNTLHTINSLVTRKQTEAASEMIIKLSDLLRFALQENQQHLIPLSKEMDMLRAYIDIISTRFGDRLEIIIYQEEELSEYLVPAFILQPLVENAVKHAAEPMAAKTLIGINVMQKNGNLVIKISDNGELPFRSINFSKGVGLQNTRERLQNLYGDKYRLDFSAGEKQGVTVELIIPLEKNLVYETEHFNS